jgi:hypothetical protein
VGGGEAGALRPVRGELVQSGGHAGPVAGSGRATLQPGLHGDALDVAPPVQRGNRHRDPHAVPGEMVQQANFPVQGGRGAMGGAGGQALSA